MAGLNTYDTIVGGAGTADYLLATAITGLTTASGALNIGLEFLILVFVVVSRVESGAIFLSL
jgi:hypothetical protein